LEYRCSLQTVIDSIMFGYIKTDVQKLHIRLIFFYIVTSGGENF